MIEWGGIQFGTLFQGGTFLTLVAVLGIWWVRGMPDRHRAKNEGRVIDDATETQRRKEARQEIHDIKNELAKAGAELVRCNKLATEANALNEQMMFLFELMLSEMETSHPDSKIVQRARLMFNRLNTELKDPNKSDALNTAEIAVEDAKQTLVSTKETCAEVKRSENDGG